MRSREETLRAIRDRFPNSSGMVSLSSMTTWRTGGPAVVASADSLEDLARLLEYTWSENIPWLVLGQGSNVLAADEGCLELIIRLEGALTKATWKLEDGSWRLSCGAGTRLPSMSGAACTRGAAGLEFAVGIPGTVGGGVFMNAGAYGSSISRFLVNVTALDSRGSTRIIALEDCDFGYRRSRFQSESWIVAGAELELPFGDPGRLRAEASRILELRRKKFPLEHPNAGSVFRKPAEDIPPGKLIEEAGLKGTAIGGAEVSWKHANFIVNRGGATSADIRALVDLVRERVLESSGILLEEEIVCIGRFQGS